MTSNLEESLTKVGEELKVRRLHRKATTNYFETLIHLFKGNVGPACFAMAEAIKNSGLVLGSCLTVLLATVCVYQQHVLIECSETMQSHFNLDQTPDYAETLELSLNANGKWKKQSKSLKCICNVFLVLTQLGFCSVYFLFVGNNMKNVLDFYGLELDLKMLMLLSLVPIILTSLITNLRYLAPFSGVANVCMFTGIVITFYYATQSLPNIAERKLVTTSIHQLPLFFGTAIYLFEGIGLVLPLKNAMRKPREFSMRFGVLNVGMVFLTALFVAMGVIGYWKYGEDVASSITLNLPSDKWLAQSVMIMISVGVILGYAIQFYIPIQIIFPTIRDIFTVAGRHPNASELLLRIFMVLVTFSVALLVPNLGLLISLIGAVCSTSLALVFPVFIEFLVLTKDNQPLDGLIRIKITLILLLAVVGFLSGGFESIRQIIHLYS